MTSRPAVPTVALNNGVGMPVLGFGVYQVPPEETQRVVADALETGYRAIDTAAGYANEAAVGAAIRESGIPRDDVFVTTKLWIQDAPAEVNTRRAFETSLERLGLDRVDLYLIHQPYGDLYGQWREMERLLHEGLVRAIGVSNLYPDRLVDLIEHHDVVPAVNQVEVHPFFQRADYQELMRKRGVVTEAWGGFAEGRNGLFTHPVLSAIAAEQGRSVGQVVLRWLVQRGVVAIPKTVRRERMAENLAVFDFELTAEQMSRVAGLDTGESVFFDHRDTEWVTRLGRVRVD